VLFRSLTFSPDFNMRTAGILSIALNTLVSANSEAQSTLRAALYERSEEYQPVISEDFPHALGAERVLAWMDKKYEPCENFYKYSCGGFQSRYEGFQKADTLELMSESNSILMEQILSQKSGDSLATTPTEIKIFEKAERYFKSCLNTDAIASRNFEPIIPLAKQIIKDCSDKLHFPHLVGNLHKHAIFAFFRVQYSKVEGHTLEDIRLHVYPAVAYEVTSADVRAILEPFFKFNVIQLPENMGMDDVVKWVTSFESVMAHFVKSANVESSGDSKSQYTTLDKLSSSTRLDWAKYLDIVGLTGATNIYLHGDADLWISILGHISEVESDYLQFYLLFKLGTFHFNKLSETYYSKLGILSGKDVRSFNDDSTDKMEIFQKNCVDEIGIHLIYLASHIYSKYAFDDEQRSAANDMIHQLKDSFGREINRLTWMDRETKDAALEKLNNLVFTVGYPEWTKDPEKIAAYYKDIDFTHDKYFENAVAAQHFAEFSPSWHQLGKPWIRDELLFGYPWQLNAFHLTDMLQIQINTGILQRPLFSHRNRDSSNYGSLGMIIGHEVSHAFDSVGRKLNSKGEQKTWWSDYATHLFSQSSMCFINQYDQYTVAMQDPPLPPAQVSGKRTLSENIADNGGLHVAYSAWKKHMDKANGMIDAPMEEYEGLTDEQLFFVSFGQTWCAVDDDKQTMFLVGNDPHSPNSIRVNGVVANSADFERVFQCRKKGYVQKRDVCSLY